MPDSLENLGAIPLRVCLDKHQDLFSAPREGIARRARPGQVLVAAHRDLLALSLLRSRFDCWRSPGDTDRQAEAEAWPGSLQSGRQVGTTPQGMPQGVQMLAQHERIDLLDPFAQLLLPSLREDARCQDALQRRLGQIVDPTHALPFRYFGLKLERRLEAVDHQAQRAIDLTQLVIRLHAFQAHTAHHRPILLLHMRLVIFEPWTPTRKRQLVLFTVGTHGLIDELGAAIGFDARAWGKGKSTWA